MTEDLDQYIIEFSKAFLKPMVEDKIVKIWPLLMHICSSANILGLTTPTDENCQTLRTKMITIENLSKT